MKYPRKKPKPASQPCRTCQNYLAKTGIRTSWCMSIEAEVEPWWTGCCRWVPTDEVTHGGAE